LRYRRNCKTCKFNFDGICGAHKSFFGYGGKILDSRPNRDCWEIGIDYFNELLAMLPESIRQEYIHRHDLSQDDLFYFVKEFQKGITTNIESIVRLSQNEKRQVERDFPLSKAQARLLGIMKIPFKEDMQYDDAKKLLLSHDLPKTGVPDNVHPNRARHLSDEKLLDYIWLEKHMEESHGKRWCPICNEYHDVKTDDINFQ
jgi:hypothetical protein